MVLSWYQYPTDRTNVSCAHPILCQIISCFAEALLEVSFVGVKDEVIRFSSLLLMMCRLQASYQCISCCLFWKFLYVHVQKWAIVWKQIRRCSECISELTWMNSVADSILVNIYICIDLMYKFGYKISETNIWCKPQHEELNLKIYHQHHLYHCRNKFLRILAIF